MDRRGPIAHGPTRRRRVRAHPAIDTGTCQVRRRRRHRSGDRPRRHRHPAWRAGFRPAEGQGDRGRHRHRRHLHRQPVLDLPAPRQPAAAARGHVVRPAQRRRPADRGDRDRGHELRPRLPRPDRVQRGERHRHRPRHDLPVLHVQEVGLPRAGRAVPARATASVVPALAAGSAPGRFRRTPYSERVCAVSRPCRVSRSEASHPRRCAQRWPGTPPQAVTRARTAASAHGHQAGCAEGTPRTPGACAAPARPGRRRRPPWCGPGTGRARFPRGGR